MLLFVPVVSSVANSLSHITQRIDRPDIPAKINVARAVLNVAIEPYLVAILGIRGAAVATLATAVVGTLAVMLYVEGLLPPMVEPAK